MVPRANIQEIKDDDTLPESFVVTEWNSTTGYTTNTFKYQIREYLGNTAFSTESTYAGTVGVPYYMNTTVKFSTINAEVPLKFDNRQLRTIVLNEGVEFNKAFNAGDDITSWFVNAPTGMKFTVANATTQYATRLNVYASGTPEKASAEKVSYIIPKDVLSFSGTVNSGTSAVKTYSHSNNVPSDGLLVSNDKMSKYAIYDIAIENPENLEVRGMPGSEIEAVTAKVKLNGTLRFKVYRQKGTDISSWFSNVWNSQSSTASDQFKYTLESDIDNGSDSFTFKVSGMQGENGMMGGAIFSLEIPSSFLQDTTGVTLPNSYSYKVAVSQSYSDIAEEYARIYITSPKLKIVSEKKDFYAVMGGIYNEFTVTYSLENATFNKDAINVNQPYYSWANESLKKSSDDVNYRNPWNMGLFYHTADVEDFVKDTPSLTTYDVNRALGLKVVNVSDNQITVKYYGVLRDAEKPDTLYLTIPYKFINGAPSVGITSEDAITIRYVNPVISFAPYGFYFDSKIKNAELKKLIQKVKGTDNEYANAVDVSERFGRLSYDISGVVGQDLSEYSYSQTLRNYLTRGDEEYHYYAFSPLNFDLIKDESGSEYEVGDDVTDLFFDKEALRDGAQIGISWKVIAKVKNKYGNLTIDEMSRNPEDEDSEPLFDGDLSDRYIYIVKAEGIPNFYTNYTEDSTKNARIEIKYRPLRFSRFYKYSVVNSEYEQGGNIWMNESFLADYNFYINSVLAPTYSLTYKASVDVMASIRPCIDRITLSVPRYNFFALYVPFRNGWEYKVKSKTYPYSSLSGKVNDTKSDLDSYYSTPFTYQINGITFANDYIPIYTQGNIGLSKYFVKYVNDGYLGFSADDSVYSSLNTYSVSTYLPEMIATNDPRSYDQKRFEGDSPSMSNYYDGWGISVQDGNTRYNNNAYFSGLFDRTSVADPYTLLKNNHFSSETSATYSYFPERNYNQVFYIAYRPRGTLRDSTSLKYKYVDMPSGYTNFSLWVKTDLFKTVNYKESGESIEVDKYGFTFTPTFASSSSFNFYKDDDFYYLSPQYDFSLPRWLKVTPSDPFDKVYQNSGVGPQLIKEGDIIPGLISSGTTDYRAVVESPINISAYAGQNLNVSDIKINLTNTTFNTSSLPSDITSWVSPSLPYGIKAEITSSSSTSINIHFSGATITNTAIEKTEMGITIPTAYLNNVNNAIFVYMKGSTYEFKSFKITSNGSIAGYQGKSLKNNIFTLVLSEGDKFIVNGNLKFKSSLLNTDVSSWFATGVSGLTYKVYKVDGPILRIVTSGTPTTVISGNNGLIKVPFSAINNATNNSNAIYRIEGVNYTICSSASASLSESVNVYHAPNNEISLSNSFVFTINLTDAMFESLSVGVDVSSWFGSSKKEGFKYTLQKAVSYGDKVAYIAVYGTPTAQYSGSISITIPSDAFVYYSSSLSVDTKGSAYMPFNLTATIVGDAITINQYRNTSVTKDFKIQLDGGAKFIAISSGYNVASWFNTILRGNVTYKVLNAVKTGDTTITIRMTTSSATASTYGVARSYTITIPKTALVFATEPLGVDVKGGTMRFNNYTQPSTTARYNVLRNRKSANGSGGIGSIDPRNSKYAISLHPFNMRSATYFNSKVFAKDNGYFNQYHYFLFYVDNIMQVGHSVQPNVGYIAQYTGYSLLEQDDSPYSGIYKLNRPYYMNIMKAGGYPQNYPAVNLVYQANLPKIYITPRSGYQSIMNTNVGHHILDMVDIWTFIYYFTQEPEFYFSKQTFQVIIHKEHDCKYGNGKCSLFENAHGTKTGYIGIYFKVPVIDLAGNAVWIWYTADGREPNVNNPVLKIGHYTGWDISVSTKYPAQ